jgi:thiamine pyrophosphate-dependent acetolactate synthase large subunit-like protein
MKTVADQQFAEVIATAEVKRIYGIVRDSLNSLTDANRRHGRIERIHVRDEEVPPSWLAPRRGEDGSLYIAHVS